MNFPWWLFIFFGLSRKEPYSSKTIITVGFLLPSSQFFRKISLPNPKGKKEDFKMKFYCYSDPKVAYFTTEDVLPEGAKEVLPNTVEAATEKHIPEVEVGDSKISVSVGSVPHPMLEAHFIKWILFENGNQYKVCVLKPGEEPKATFCYDMLHPNAKVYAFCNLHGLWLKAL